MATRVGAVRGAAPTGGSEEDRLRKQLASSQEENESIMSLQTQLQATLRQAVTRADEAEAQLKAATKKRSSAEKEAVETAAAALRRSEEERLALGEELRGAREASAASERRAEEVREQLRAQAAKLLTLEARCAAAELRAEKGAAGAQVRNPARALRPMHP